MKRAVALTFVVVLISASVALAQAPQAPKPGAAHKKLGYFTGKWTSTADMKESPFGPAGKMTFTDNVAWLPGGFFLVSRSKGTGPMGDMTAITVMGYNEEEKVYFYHAFNSLGQAEYSKGTVEGDTWNWASESKIGGKVVKSRFSIKELPPRAYSYHWDMLDDAGKWSTLMEGKTTKVAAKKPAPAGQ